MAVVVKLITSIDLKRAKNRSSCSAEKHTHTHRSKTEQMRGGTEEEIVFRFDVSIHVFSISSANRLQFTSILDHINERIYKIQDLQDITHDHLLTKLLAL